MNFLRRIFSREILAQPKEPVLSIQIETADGIQFIVSFYDQSIADAVRKGGVYQRACRSTMPIGVAGSSVEFLLTQSVRIRRYVETGEYHGGRMVFQEQLSE